MKYFSLTAIALSICISSFSFAADEAAMSGTAKIVKAPDYAVKPAMIVASAFVRAAEFAPDSNGWGEKDFEGAIGAMAMNASMRLMSYMQTKSLTPAGPMFAVWYQDPTVTPAGDLTSKWCFPISGDQEPAANVTIEQMPETPVVTCTFEGHPNSSMNAWAEVIKYAETNGLEWAGAPMEVYHKNGMQSDKAEDWLIEIAWPAMKKQVAPPAAEGEKKEE